MGLSRNITTKIHFVFDQLIPPILRDYKLFMYLPFRILYGNKTELFFGFKDRVHSMSKEEFSKVYNEISKVIVERDTDLNSGCIKRILDDVIGETVLEVGCGKALLSSKIAEKKFKVTALDININEEMKNMNPSISFVNGNAENLPFGDNSFDTIVCTHTLEHVQNFETSVSELRRVCRKKLIIVVPKQRPYKYTFDLHVHFFPYKHSFLKSVNPPLRHVCEVIDGDIYYLEEKD